MTETKIRFGRRAWALIREEAKIDGVSASQYVREAAIARAFYTRYKRGELREGEGFDAVIKSLRDDPPDL